MSLAQGNKHTDPAEDRSRVSRSGIRQSQWSVKSRSRAPGQCAFSKSVSRTITMQGFILTANTAAKKKNFISRLDVIFLDSTQKFDKVSGA